MKKVGFLKSPLSLLTVTTGGEPKVVEWLLSLCSSTRVVSETVSPVTIHDCEEDVVRERRWVEHPVGMLP